MTHSPQPPIVIQQSPGTSGLAIAGLVFSILGWFTCGLLCVPGAFLCIFALFLRGPKSAAIAGLIIGFPGVLFFVFVGLGMIMGLLGLGVAAISLDAEVEKTRAELQVQQVDIDVMQTPETAKSESDLEISTESTSHVENLSVADNVSVDGFDDFSVSVENWRELTNCQVTFHSLPPTSTIASAVVHNEIEKLVKEDGSRGILAMAFDASGDALDDILYGGPLSYEPSDGLVLTMDERGGLSASEEDEGTYFVRVEDSRTAEGITPVRQWYYVIILFPHEPSGMEVKAAVLKEIDKLKPRGLDVHASLYTGDKTNKIVWKQIKALNDKFMAVNYDAATGRILPNWDWDSVHAAVEGPKYEIRTWTDATGKHKTQARFGGSAFGEVKLVNKAGKWIRLPLDKLSDEDQQWVRDRKRP